MIQLAALALITSALVIAGPASAGHSVCHNETNGDDINAGVVGVDTGGSGTGTNVCILTESVGVDGDPPENGSGLVIEVINCHGDNTPCDRLLEHTGAGVSTNGPGTLGIALYLYVNGNEV